MNGLNQKQVSNASISIIVTTKSKTSNIIRLTESLHPIKKYIHEYIIVDAGTPDIYNIVIDSFKDFPIIIDGTGTNRSSGKNLGVKYSSGGILVFLNDDTEICNDYILEVKKSMVISNVAVGYSSNPLGRDMSRVSCCVDGIDISYPSCNMVCMKSVFDRVGLFNESMVTAEDMDFNYRCIKHGFNIFYNPRLRVHHFHRSTFKGFARQAFWNGYGRRQLNRIHPELKKLHDYGLGFKSLERLGFGFLGYMSGDLFK